MQLTDIQSLWALPAALLAGMLLNMTPCVLPAVPVKIRTILVQSGNTPGRRLFAALAFMSGTLTLFLPLGGLTALFHWNWGTLFQSPTMLSLLVIALLAFAAMTWFDMPLPIPTLSPKAAGHGYMEAFMSGLLSAVLAAPCAGPLLGGVLVFAIARPAPVILLVFTLIGVGLALPYVVLLLRPQWLRRLPHGGPWLIVIRQSLAWVLVAAAVFFSASLLPDDIYRRLWWLWLLLVALWGVNHLLRSTMAGRILALSVTGLALALTLSAARPEEDAGKGGIDWVPYAASEMGQIQGMTQPFMVEFTAKWCINCKVLEETVYASHAVARKISDIGMATIQVDLTRSNPPGEALLAYFGGHALPFAVVVDRNDKIVKRFSGLFSADQLIAAVEKARDTIPMGAQGD